MFTKWIKEKLLLNFENKKTFMIMDPYHFAQFFICPTSKCRKQEIKNWLPRHVIPCREEIYVPILYQLLKLHKKRFIRFVIDDFLQKGHDILRLPPCFLYLNPTERIWAKLKNYVPIRNTIFRISDAQVPREERFLIWVLNVGNKKVKWKQTLETKSLNFL